MTDGPNGADDLHLLLDGRLNELERRAVEIRLRDDASYRAEYEELLRLRQALRSIPKPELPEDLWLRIEGSLRNETRQLRGVDRRRNWQLAAAILLCLLPVGFVAQRWLTHDVIVAVTDDASEFAVGRLRLDLQTTTPAILEAHFKRTGLDFSTRVLDLRMMGYELVGGSRHAVDGHPSALFIYRGPAGESVLCQMFKADLQPFVRGSKRRQHNGIDFYIHRRGAITAVFWAEGGVICMLQSSADPEATIALAMAKAMRV